MKQTKHHDSALTQLNFCCQGDASVSLAYLKTEFNEDIENYYDIINLSVWSNWVAQSPLNFDLLEEKKSVDCLELEGGSKDLAVECSTIYIQEKQIYLLKFRNPEDRSVRLHVKLKYPEAQFIFLGFERVEKDGVLATEIIGPKEETYLMLKNLSHYDTISSELAEDFEIEIDEIRYQIVHPAENRPEYNFL